MIAVAPSTAMAFQTAIASRCQGIETSSTLAPSRSKARAASRTASSTSASDSPAMPNPSRTTASRSPAMSPVSAPR
ncbi:MAG: hypothetical protein K0S88_124 [Actinomycetia bacterium]|nr:hypothetical protein [Actinomycetes bacterium]